jgi:hypothetical protein
VEPEDVVYVLHNMIEAVEPGGLILDLQVIRPDPVVEAAGQVVCEIDGSPLFRTADTAAAALDAAVRDAVLIEEARDDHDVRERYGSGAELIARFAGKNRKLPVAAMPQLRQLGSCAVRERCRIRRLRVAPAARISVARRSADARRRARLPADHLRHPRHI